MESVVFRLFRAHAKNFIRCLRMLQVRFIQNGRFVWKNSYAGRDDFDLKAEGMTQLNHIRLIIFESDKLGHVFGDNFENDFKLVNEIQQFNPESAIDYNRSIRTCQ